MSSAIYILNAGEVEREQTRLDFQHIFLRELAGDRLLPDVATSHLQSLPAPKIADIGTGTGTFLLDLARQLPAAAELDGFDIDETKFMKDAPGNIKLRRGGDVLKPFPEEMHGKYDLVHARLLIYALKKDDWVPVAKNLKTLLKPNGYIVWLETDSSLFISVPFSKAHVEWLQLDYKAATKVGRNPIAVSLLPIHLKDAGFKNIDDRLHTTLSRPWLESKTNTVATKLFEQSLTGLVNMGILGDDLTKDRAEKLIAEFKNDIENGININWGWQWAWGQRPE